jgi:hypothetical protein
MKTWQDILTYEALDLLGPQPELKDDPAELLLEVSVEGLTLGEADLQACGRALLTLVRYHASLV